MIGRQMRRGRHRTGTTVAAGYGALDFDARIAARNAKGRRRHRFWSVSADPKPADADGGRSAFRLGSRTLELLITLVENAGEVLSNKELIARVWPDNFVEEGNLRKHIAALRRALGGCR